MPIVKWGGGPGSQWGINKLSFKYIEFTLSIVHQSELFNGSCNHEFEYQESGRSSGLLI